MKKRLIVKSNTLALALAGLGMTFAATAKADCGTPANRLSSSAAESVAPRATLSEERAGTPDATTSLSYGASIVGLWMSTFTSGGVVVDTGFDQWNSDGNEILNDDPAPATGNVCLGVYVQTGPATYKLKHPSWTFDNYGIVNGTAIIREQVTVAPGGNKYQGTYTLDLYDTNNNHFAHYSGTISAQRITVDF